MLIRISGAHSGIKEYLEEGQKKDRFFTRDELDNRVILDGNLSVTNTIINSIETKHDRYFHITLSFKEDHISPEILENINQEFKEYFLHSYTEDEINYYAEAHLPKIKSYISAKDNTLVERKPHIHIVIPTTNLFTNTSFYPSIKHITKYIDAFQEYVNAKYGLESPKDNFRTKLTDTSEMISRYKGDIFTNQGKEQKTAILDLIIGNNPTNLNELKTLLIKNGYAVKLRNKDNAASCYLNIKTLGDAKGINLKEFVFREEFLKLSLVDKLTKLNQEHNQSSNDKTPDNYLQSSLPKPVSVAHEKLMQEWKTTKALEHRFIHRSASKAQCSRYKKLSHEDKIAYLQQKHNTYYQRYNKFLEGIYNDRDNGATIDDITNISRSNDAILNDIKASAERIRDVKGGYNPNLIRESLTRASKERYRAHLSNNKANEQHALKDSYLTELIQQNDEKTKQQTFKNYLHELNTTLHADILLELVKKTYGINPEVYLITKNSSGLDRIKCGDRNLSVVDFCTKELNLSFKETVQLLENAYNMQHELQQANILDTKNDLYLKDKYQEWFKSYKATRSEKLKECTNKTKATRETIIAEVRNQIKSLRENKSLPYFKRAQQINILKANQIIELKALTEAKLHEQKQIREIFNLEIHSAYRNFLTHQANLGDEIALKELRRLRTNFDKNDKNQNNQQNSFNYVDYYKEFRLNITHIIDNNGNICYMLDSNLIIKDTGRKIEVIHDTADNVKLTLELALAKFGKNIELSGTKEFRQKVVDLAIKDKRNVNFLDEFSKQYYNSCLEQMKSTPIKKSNHNNINMDKER